jgi:SAM-dependent methyltransferase
VINSVKRARNGSDQSPFAVGSGEDEAANIQESFYHSGVDYRVGSPHLSHRDLYDRLVCTLRHAVTEVSEAGLPLDVVEIGAGHGGFTEPMLAAGCRVTALEMSRPSVDRLNALFASNPLFRSLYTPDGSFGDLAEDYSIAACVSVLHHIPDYLGALHDLVSRIRPGGAVIILQEPLWYSRMSGLALRLNRLGYLLWRLRQGSLRRGLATQVRRVRGVYDEANPSDMIEYHVVRDGVDEVAVHELLGKQFETVEVLEYWSNQSSLIQSLGERMCLKNSFGIVAAGRIE